MGRRTENVPGGVCLSAPWTLWIVFFSKCASFNMHFHTKGFLILQQLDISTKIKYDTHTNTRNQAPCWQDVLTFLVKFWRSNSRALRWRFKPHELRMRSTTVFVWAILIFTGFSAIRITQNQNIIQTRISIGFMWLGNTRTDRGHNLGSISRHYQRIQAGSACLTCQLSGYWATPSENLSAFSLSLLSSSRSFFITSRTRIRLNTTGKV